MLVGDVAYWVDGLRDPGSLVGQDDLGLNGWERVKAQVVWKTPVLIRSQTHGELHDTSCMAKIKQLVCFYHVSSLRSVGKFTGNIFLDVWT